MFGGHPYARGLARLAGAPAEPADAPPQTLQRTLLFGETLLFNRQQDYLEKTYAERIGRLMRDLVGGTPEHVAVCFDRAGSLPTDRLCLSC